MKASEILKKNIGILSKYTVKEESFVPGGHAPLPEIDKVKRIVSLSKTIFFTDYFFKRQPEEQIRQYYIGVNMEELFSLLKEQIARSMLFNSDEDEAVIPQRAVEFALHYIDRMPDVKRLLYSDVEAMFDNDPAATNYGEVIFCYPVVNAMTHYRIAHELHKLGIPVLPRIITELAHSKTGIDIHPGATIGDHFSIDHGTGVVIGETAIIGSHVTLYQGVTLGAKSFKYDADGNMINCPRHPILEDNVTVYSNSSILGRITIGHDSVGGGNIWLSHSIPPHSKILQSKAIDASFTGGLGI